MTAEQHFLTRITHHEFQVSVHYRDRLWNIANSTVRADGLCECPNPSGNGILIFNLGQRQLTQSEIRIMWWNNLSNHERLILEDVPAWLKR